MTKSTDYSEIYNAPERDYSGLSAKSLADLCILKDRSKKLFAQRLEQAQKVIDEIAIFIDVADSGRYLYGVFEDGRNPILEKLKSWIDKSGDKTQLKKRVTELEKENEILRSLLTK